MRPRTSRSHIVRCILAVAIMLGTLTSAIQIASSSRAGAAVTPITHKTKLKHPTVTGTGTLSQNVIAPDVAGCTAPQLIAGISEYQTHPNGGTFQGYWQTGQDGGVFSFPTPNVNTPFYNSLPGEGICPNQPIVGISATPDGGGYWLVGLDGGIYTFGDATFYGSMGGSHLNAPVVGMTPTSDGHGYWLVASDGGIFSFGDAVFEGSMGGTHLNKPIVAIAGSGTTGYWMVGSDGGVFAFGTAPFYGGTGGSPPPSPVTGMTANPARTGYWLVTSAGLVYSFGSAPYEGGLPTAPAWTVMGITSDSSGSGYWMVDYEGHTYSFGDAAFGGNAPPVAQPPVSVVQQFRAMGNPVSNYIPPCRGDPVNCESGAFWQTYTDVKVPGRGPSLDLERTYNSQDASQLGIFGNGWSSSYTMSLSISGATGAATVIEADGSTAYFTTTGNGIYTAAPGTLATLTLNGDGTFTFILRNSQIYNFSAAGQLTSIKDLNGYTTSLGYNGSSQLTSVTDPSGRQITLGYGTNGLISTVTDPSGQVTNYGYDASNNLTSVKDPLNRTTAFTYYSGSLMHTITTPNGGVTTNVYNGSNQVTSQTDPMNLTTTWAYSGNNGTSGTTTITDPHGSVTVENFTGGFMMSKVVASGTSKAATWSYTYDPNTFGQTTVTDPNNHTTTTVYDANGNVTSSTDALNNTTTTTYNGFNEPLTVTDPKGIVTTNTYDGNGNLLTKTVTGVGGSPVATTTYTYGDSGHPGDITSVTDPAGEVTSHTYDTYGDVATTSTHRAAPATSATSPADKYSYQSISAVGTLVSKPQASGGIASIAVTPQAVGDAFVLGEMINSTSITVASVTGGGATWTKLTSTYSADQSRDMELWLGTITTAGASTITVTGTASLTGVSGDISVQEYTNGTGASTLWTKDTAGIVDTSGNSTVVPFPTLAPAGTGELYAGFGRQSGTSTGGSTPGFTYQLTNTGNPYIYNPAVSASVSPTDNQASSSHSLTTGALIQAVGTFPSGGGTGTVSAVGTLTAHSGTAQTTLAVSPHTVGNAEVLGVKFDSSTITISSVSGGGATWTKLTNATDTTQTRDMELWLGTVTTPGASTITITPSSSLAGIAVDMAVQEYTNGTGASTVWTKDVVGNLDNNVSSTTVGFPSLTPAAPGELYAGFGRQSNTSSPGSTPGFTYQTTGGGNPYLYDPSVSTTVSPSALQSPAGHSLAVGALIAATGGPGTGIGLSVGAITPHGGSGAGGTSVTILGSGFIGVTSVIFGSVAAPSFTVNSSKSITATAPSGAAGTVDVSVVTSGAATTSYVYDVMGRKVCQASANAVASGVACPAAGQPRVPNTTTWVYDADSEMTSMTDPLAKTTSYLYDGDGNQVQVTDPLSNVTKTTYDADDRKTQVTQGYGSPAASSTNYAYDIVPGSGICSSSVTGSLYCTTTTDPKGAVTINWFDAKNLQIQSVVPSSGTTVDTYDLAGNLSTENTAGGLATYGYDADNDVKTITYSSPKTGFAVAHNVSYNYDADLKRTQMVDGSGTTTYTYDALERLGTVVNGAGASTSYGYDLDNHLTLLTYPNTKLVTYAYDGAGQVTSITDWLGNVTAYAYDADGNQVTEAQPNGDSVTTTYDADDHSTSTGAAPNATPSSPLVSMATTRNANGQVATETDTGTPTPLSQTYSYDQVNRLASNSQGAYAYDTAGNPTALATGATQTFNSSEQVTTGVKGSTTTTYGYDGLGDRTSAAVSGGSTSTYGYDQAGRLVTFGSTASYGYNGDGLRMSKTVSGTTTQETWSAVSTNPEILVDGAIDYVFDGNGLPLEQINGTTPTYYVHDQLGSTRALLTQTGTLTATYTYDSYGNLAGSTGSVTNPLRYAGQYTDTETGFQYLENRYFDSMTAEFISVDPAIATTGAPYFYAGDNPVNLTDPTGLCFLFFCSVTRTVKRTAEFAAGLTIIVGVNAIADTENFFQALGEPEDSPALPLSYLLDVEAVAMTAFGLGLIYKSLGKRPPVTQWNEEPGPIPSSHGAVANYLMSYNRARNSTLSAEGSTQRC